jgi:hypothetical protein
MIRELTKSALSFSWALSLLGIKQVVNLGRSGQSGGDPFGPVTQVAVSQLDESMKGIFRSGDNLQSRMVDMAFVSMNPVNWINPSRWTPGRPVGNVTQAPDGPATQTGHQATGPIDSPAFWMNPFNWVNPANWPVRSVMGCSQPGGGCSSQTSGQTTDSTSTGGAPTGWGPMSGSTP